MSIGVEHHRRLARLLPLAMLLAGRQSPAAPAAALTPGDRRSVEVHSPACKEAAFPMVPFLDSLRVELSGRALACCTLAEDGDETGLSSSVRVTIAIDPCVPDGERVRVAVLDGTSGDLTERGLSLADVDPPVRPRALALAVAELIRSTERAPAPQPPPVSPPMEAARAPSPALAEALQPSGISLGFEGEARALPGQHTTMWGGRLRWSLPWRGLHAALDGGADFASAHDDLGDVVLRYASVGGALGPRLANRMVACDLGVRAELGWAWILGETARTGVRAHDGSQPIFSAGLRAALEIPAYSWARPSIALEGGGVLLGVTGEASKRPVVGMSGYYLRAAVGFVVSP